MNQRQFHVAMRISGRGVAYSALRRCQSETKANMPLAVFSHTGPDETRTYRVDPEPGAMAATRRAGRHPLRDLEVREAVPDTGVVDAEYSEVFWLNLGHVRFVGDGEGAALQVVEPRRVHRPARETPVARRAGVIALADIGVALGRRPVRRKTLVAGELGRGGLSRGKLEDISGIGRVVEVSVEPPLVEVHVHEGCDGAVVVWERLLGDVETVHTRMENGWKETFSQRRIQEASTPTDVGRCEGK